VVKFVEPTGNIYESLNVIARYSNQVAIGLKNEINEKLAEFGNGPDNLEEVHENREQIEISRLFERQPKPIQIALEDFKEGKVFWRNPTTEVVE
jgi:DNA-directed RNA polymerase subunit K/omega